MSAEPSSTPIEYAPPASRRRRRVRHASVVAVLVLLAASSFVWGPWVWHRAQLGYWYRRCLAHESPAGIVVQRFQSGVVQAPASSSGYVPREWGEFYNELSPPGFQSQGTAFLGRRHTPSGREVLVAVDVKGFPPWSTGLPSHGIELHVRVFANDGFTSAPRQIYDGSRNFQVSFVDFRMLAGEVDPNDPTHFTIRYAREGLDNGLDAIGTIDGWVFDDSVKLDSGPNVVTPRLPKSPG